MSTASTSSGPRLRADDVLEVGRLRRQAGDRLLDERVLLGDLEHGGVRALEADRRRDLQVHPGPAAQRAAQVPRPDLAGVGKLQELLVQRAEDVVGALALVHREVGPRDVAHEERVARQHGPRLVAALGVDQRERRVLGPVAGRVDRAHADAARARAPSRPRTARGRSPARRRGGRGSSRRWRPPGARGRTRGRRGCASRGCARCGRRGSARDAGTPRSRAWGRSPPRRPRPRRRRGRTRTRGRRG